MITEQPTNRYEVNTKKVIEASFTGAYDSSSDAPVVYPPDLSVTISGIISMLLIAGMCALTFVQMTSVPWLIVGIASIGVIGLIVYRYIKAKKKYDAYNREGSQKFDYKAEYMSLFPQNLPDRMPAADLTREIAPMQNKQPRDVYNNAVRDLITKLNTVNNPPDILCRSISLYGDLFTQPRRRCYIKVEGSDVVVYDADFLEPRGELVMDASDVLSYGTPDKYNASELKKNGGKINQDSIIIEIRTGEEEKDRLYLEAHTKDLERIKKLLGVKKEK